VPLSTFGKVAPNLEPYIVIPHKTTNCSPPNYICIDAGGSLEVKDFYFSNFDLLYFNIHHMDFNPVKCIMKYKALVTGNWNGSL